jgi:hypothetical protein
MQTISSSKFQLQYQSIIEFVLSIHSPRQLVTGIYPGNKFTWFSSIYVNTRLHIARVCVSVPTLQVVSGVLLEE